MILEYFANFCDSGVCLNERHRCKYPIIKQAPLEEMYPTPIDVNWIVKKCRIELEAHDKFHVYYPRTAKWNGRFCIADKEIYKFEIPCDSNMKYIDLEFLNLDILRYIAQDANISCELYIDDDVVCPYNLSLLIEVEN